MAFSLCAMVPLAVALYLRRSHQKRTPRGSPRGAIAPSNAHVFLMFLPALLVLPVFMWGLGMLMRLPDGNVVAGVLFLFASVAGISIAVPLLLAKLIGRAFYDGFWEYLESHGHMDEGTFLDYFATVLVTSLGVALLASLVWK